MSDIVPFLIGLVFLGFASWHDVRTREVPDLISYGLLLFAVGYSLAKTILLWSWTPLLQATIGGLVLFGLGALMYWLRQWGGADAKLIAGIGSLLGLGLGSWDAALFLILMLLAGAAYGICFTIVLAVRHKNVFVKRFKSVLREPIIHRLRIAIITAEFCLLLAALFLVGYRLPLLFLAVTVYLLFYLWLLIRVVEETILIKELPVAKLREGDWIWKDVIIKGKVICGPEDQGVTNEQIAALKRLKIQNVWVKEGVPFVPSFLIAYAAFPFLQHALVTLLALV